MTREEFIKTTEFWLVDIQSKLYQEVENYIESKKINRTEFANELGVTKGYVSQILNGDYNHRLNKFIDLALHIGKAPIVKLQDLSEFIVEDSFDNESLNDLLIEVKPFDIVHSKARIDISEKEPIKEYPKEIIGTIGETKQNYEPQFVGYGNYR